MSLPKIDLPIYEMKLFSSKKNIKYRPFTVKEEKILLTAQESDSIEQAILAMKQVVNNCVFDLDINELPLFDLEYVLLNLRSKSVNNKAEFMINDPDTNENIKLELNLDDVKLIENENHTNKIKLNDQFTLFLKYPSLEQYAKIFSNEREDDSLNNNYEILISCLDKVASEDAVYVFKDFSREEINDFIDDLASDVIEKIIFFFESMPKLRHEIKYKNSNDQEKTFVIEGVDSFFL